MCYTENKKIANLDDFRQFILHTVFFSRGSMKSGFSFSFHLAMALMGKGGINEKLYDIPII